MTFAAPSNAKGCTWQEVISFSFGKRGLSTKGRVSLHVPHATRAANNDSQQRVQVVI